MKLDFSGITLKKSYVQMEKDFSLTVWGDYYQDIPEKLDLESFSIDELQKLNFDGSYIAHYKSSQGEVVFRGNQDLSFMFYCVDGNTIYFSDDYYQLVRRFKHVTWNLSSISDYFEDAWNNIAKYDRTPLREIKKLDVWNYMILDSSCNDYNIGCWKNINKEKHYTIHNMEQFKKEFLNVLDYYLTKIHKKYHDVAIPVSGGIDANLIAARWSMLYPNDKTRFFTSKVNDVADESKIASNMQKVVTAPIEYIPIRTEERDLLNLLRDFIDKYLPPRFVNEINEQLFINSLSEHGIRNMNLSGMGADINFGGFGGEYWQLMCEKLRRLQFLHANEIYKAIMVSFSGGYKLSKFIFACAKFYAKSVAEKFGYNHKSYQPQVVKVSLPKRESEKISNYEEAMRYAQEDGAARVISNFYHEVNIGLCCPFEGYRFSQLSAKCDPFIFSKDVNKYCLRYVGHGLLPKEILDNKVKRGNPGVSLQKIINTDLNRIKITEFLDEIRESPILNIKLMKEHIKRNCFDQKDFLALSLLVFQQKLEEMGIRIDI